RRCTPLPLIAGPAKCLVIFVDGSIKYRSIKRLKIDKGFLTYLEGAKPQVNIEVQILSRYPIKYRCGSFPRAMLLKFPYYIFSLLLWSDGISEGYPAPVLLLEHDK